MSGQSSWAAAALAHIGRTALGAPVDPSLRVTVNFHPDRRHGGLSVLQAMSADGIYRSQFETGTSNGGLTAHPGGDRWRWEQRIFGGVYDEAPPGERPRYGALNHRRRPVGGAPRFGSAHLRLAPHTLARTTFCYPDSVFEPEHLGTARAFDLVRRVEADLASGAVDDLDAYVEAHLHGVVDLAEDVEALVLDPCFRGSEIERASEQLPCAVEWHGGFRVDVDTVARHPDYRGPRIVALAQEVAVDGWLDPAVVGAAAATGGYEFQDIKRVWHLLARFGAPDLPDRPQPNDGKAGYATGRDPA